MDIEAEVNKHLKNIEELQAASGLFLASAQGVATGYDKAWLRDNFYTAFAFESVEQWSPVLNCWQAILAILGKHQDKIRWAIENRPRESWQYIHARYHPETFDEFWEEWGNKQNDAVGAVLFKLLDLQDRGQSVVNTDSDRALLQTLVDYLVAIEYWHDPDNGIWEEYEEVHASSIAAALAALKKADQTPYLSVPSEAIAEGERSLFELLPRESSSKFSDLALLSLVYPYDLITRDQAEEILTRMLYQFDRRHGIIRYKQDYYYNKNEDGYSEEAEWVMGFPWLAIIYSRWGEQELARHYLQKTKQTETADGRLPELYYSNSDQPNENIPLGWAESLMVVALKEYQRKFETDHLE